MAYTKDLKSFGRKALRVQLHPRPPLNDFAFGPKKYGFAFWPFGRPEESDGGLIAKIVLRKTFSKKVFLNVPFQNDGFAGKDLKQNLRRRKGGKGLRPSANFDGLKPPMAAEDQILARQPV